MRARKVDLTQRVIVDALRGVGAHVWIIGEPCDLLIWWRGDWILMECKTGKRKRKDQPKQEAFLYEFSVPVVRSPENALRAIGALR
jgi:hypothetical protein